MLQLVSQYVQDVQEISPERIMRFVIDGDDEVVLTEITEKRKSNLLSQLYWSINSQTDLLQFYQLGNPPFKNIQVFHPIIGYRLAKLYEALCPYEVEPEPLSWLIQLLAGLSPYGLSAYYEVTDPATLSVDANFIEQLLQVSNEPVKNLA